MIYAYKAYITYTNTHFIYNTKEKYKKNGAHGFNCSPATIKLMYDSIIKSSVVSEPKQTEGDNKIINKLYPVSRIPKQSYDNTRSILSSYPLI